MEKITSISSNAHSTVFFDEEGEFEYIINKGQKGEKLYTINHPYGYAYVSDTIIEDNNDYVNGFKLVKTANGQCAYVKEEDSILMPYRFDIATDFNEHGLAMIGLLGHVSWINRKFEILTPRHGFVNEKEYDKIKTSEGIVFREVHEFSKNSNPLSRLYNWYGSTCYIKPNGELQEFQHFDGETFTPASSYFNGPNYSDFNQNGIAIADENAFRGIISADGYYCTLQDIIKIISDSKEEDTLSQKSKTLIKN